MPRCAARVSGWGNCRYETSWARISRPFRIFSIRDESGRLINIATIVSDISEMKMIEERLTRAQRMESLGRLTGASPTITTTSFTAILGFGQVLRSEMDPDDPRTGLVDEIVKAGTVSAGITRQLLAFGKTRCSNRASST